jgi:hypothetical protein
MSETADTGVDLQHLSSVVLGAVVVGATAAWVAAEVAGPVPVFVATALVAGYLLGARRGEREKLVFVGYAVVAILAVSPALFFLPDVLSGRTVVLFQTMTVVVTRMLLGVAGVVGYAVYRLDGGTGVLERARTPERRTAIAAYAVAVGLFVLPFVLFVVDLVAGTNAVELPGVLGWRLLGLVAVAIGYGAYRLDGDAGSAATTPAGRPE